MTPNYIFVFVFCLLGACNSSMLTPVDFPDDIIYFGYSGGIANMTTEYCLLENGNLLKKNENNGYDVVSKVDNRQCKQLFSNVAFLGLTTMNLKDPGNKTNFIRFKYEVGISEIAWGGNQVEPAKEVATYYATLMNLVTKEN